MCLSEKRSERARLGKVTRNDASKFFVKSVEMNLTHEKNLRVEHMSNEMKNLRETLLDKDAVTRARASNYKKRAIPFDMSNEDETSMLQSICNVIGIDPWNDVNYKRHDLARDIGELFQKIEKNEIVLMKSADYEVLVKTAAKATKTSKKKKTTKKPKK